MTLRPLLTGLVFAGVLSLGGSARATAGAERGAALVEKPLAVRGVIGAGTPVGFLGLEGEYGLGRYFAPSAGLGRGASGLQLAAMPRFRFPISPTGAFSVGLGWSYGPYQWKDFVCYGGCLTKAGHVHWGNFEMGIEHRGPSSSSKLFWGVGHAVSGLRCVSDCDDDYAGRSDGETIAFVGLAVGPTF